MPDRFLSLAYGSNMFTRRLTERTPSAAVEGIGYVSRHRLTFDKWSADGSGKCDMEDTGEETDRVYGVLFSILKSEESDLDAAEGLGKGYRKEKVAVQMGAETIEAIAYIATKKEPASRPYHWYKAFVVSGAIEHGLPASYVEWLRTIISQPDPDVTRRTKQEAILFGTSCNPSPSVESL